MLSLLASHLTTSSLPTMLTVDWRRVADLPSQGPALGGFQDSDGGFVLNGSAIVTAFGYGSGGMPGFWLMKITDGKSAWEPLPSAPVSGRQEVAAAVIGDSVFYVGGFNYESPYTYDDVLRLAADGDGGWQWARLPSLPHRIASAGVAALGTRLYVVGGMDYDGAHFYTCVRV